MRAPATVVGFTLTGLFRGALTGVLFGSAIGAIIWLLLGDDRALNPFLLLVMLGAIYGVVLGIAFGLIVGFIAGLLRFRFVRLPPVAAGVTFLLAFAIGCVLTILNADRWQHFAMFGSWTVGIAILFAILAWIASRGLTGVPRDRSDPRDAAVDLG
jgi:hypothetical protein